MRELNFLLLVILASLCPSLHGYHWCYSRSKCGPSTWPLRNCWNCSGNRQSPVNIHTSKTITSTSLRTLRIERTFCNKRAVMENDGHNYYIFPQFPVLMSGGNLPGIYRLLQFHFHFGDGSRLDRGSEHQINHKAFPMEMHLVFWNMKYLSSDVAKKSPDGFAVVAVFLKVTSTPNAGLEPVVKMLSHIGYKGKRHTLSLNLDKIIPWKLAPFYRYEGSLTTPPCTENVVWIVVKNPMSVSLSQYKAFVKSMSWDSYSYRPLQPLNGRKVFYCDGE